MYETRVNIHAYVTYVCTSVGNGFEKINSTKLRKINKCHHNTRLLSHLTIITLIWDVVTNLLCFLFYIFFLLLLRLLNVVVAVILFSFIKCCYSHYCSGICCIRFYFLLGMLSLMLLLLLLLLFYCRLWYQMNVRVLYSFTLLVESKASQELPIIIA